MKQYSSYFQNPKYFKCRSVDLLALRQADKPCSGFDNFMFNYHITPSVLMVVTDVRSHRLRL